MNVHDTVKTCLLEYPSLFSCRMDVFAHLFSCIGNGYEWVKGELCYSGDSKEIPTVMKYSDLDDEDAYTQKLEDDFGHKYNKGLFNAFRLETQFKRLKRQFIEQNIDICAGNGKVLLKPKYEYHLGAYMGDHICTDYAYLFNIPKDATEDWLLAAKEFGEFWYERLRGRCGGFVYYKNKDNPHYRVKSLKDCPRDWKKDWKSCKLIEGALKNIEVLRGTALTPEEAKTKQDMVDEMISEILNKDSKKA